ncbi:MAG: hypothetical protein ABI678_20935 [Kofleriaceae bacterium]
MLAILFVVGCQATDPQPPPPNTASADETLVLEAASQTALRGTFRHGATTVRFDMYQDGVVQRVAIASADNHELVTQTQVGDTLGISVFGGVAGSYTDLAVVRASARMGAAPTSAEGADAVARVDQNRLAAEGAVALVGDQHEFVRFEELPEAATVAWLSRALGMRGYNGRDYPLTLRLHLLGSQLASHLALAIPTDGAVARQADFVDEDGGDDGGGGGGGGGASCKDLRGDPNGDNSYGLCGPGGSCWSWTCGDCCCHDGCKSHDWTCRNCHWYTPWNCILCGTFASMIAGGCGTSCQETTYAQPCTIGPYEQCNGSCECTGAYDGSTEEGAAPVQWGCQQMTQCDPSDYNCDTSSYCMPLPY